MTRRATILLGALGVWSMALLVGALPNVCASGDDAAPDEVTLERAEWKEFIAGDLDAAIAGYDAITKNPGAAAATRARAALGIARCQRKLGEVQKARTALQQLLADFPAETAILEEARSYLRELEQGKSDSDAG